MSDCGGLSKCWLLFGDDIWLERTAGWRWHLSGDDSVEMCELWKRHLSSIQQWCEVGSAFALMQHCQFAMLVCQIQISSRWVLQ
jgi:hypothetical protein